MLLVVPMGPLTQILPKTSFNLGPALHDELDLLHCACLLHVERQTGDLIYATSVALPFRLY